jgi:hypothetical protein
VPAVEIPIGFLRRRVAALLEEQEPRPLTVCPSCGSAFVQPQSWKELPSGDLFLRLRCPECLLITSGTFGQDRVAEYDQALVEGKEATIAHYDAAVRHNMEELLGRFQKAFELDLISAGDFELGAARRAPRAGKKELKVESIQRR